MQNKRNIIIAIIAVVVVVVAIVLLSPSSQNTGNNQPAESTTSGTSTPAASGATFKPLDTKTAAQYTLSKPAETAPTPPQYKGPEIKVFDLKESKDGFSPDTIVVGTSDRVQIKFTAVDGDYDLVIAPPIGVYVSAAKGGTTMFGFSTDKITPGVYTFVCQKACPDKKPISGTLVIK